MVEQKYEKYQCFLSENFHFFVVKFSAYLNRHVFVMVPRLFYCWYPRKAVLHDSGILWVSVQILGPI